MPATLSFRLFGFDVRVRPGFWLVVVVTGRLDDALGVLKAPLGARLDDTAGEASRFWMTAATIAMALL